MTTVNPAARQGASSQQAAVEAALLLLERMGLSPADLAAAPKGQSLVPTFAGYVPVVSAAVSAGTRRAYGSYWNRVIEHWGQRRLDEITPAEIRQLMTHVKTHVVARRNARGGRSAAEHLIAALRCLYRHAENDGLIAEAGAVRARLGRHRQGRDHYIRPSRTRPRRNDAAGLQCGGGPRPCRKRRAVSRVRSGPSGAQRRLRQAGRE